MKLVAGVDIGGTNSVFGLVNVHGEIIARDHVATTDYPEPEQLVKVISQKLKVLLRNLNLDESDLKGIGIGAPNGNYFTGTVDFAPNMGWKGVVPLVKLFIAEIPVPVILTNDANAAAMGEMIFGGAKNIRDFLFITLGTGLGSGIVVNGEMVYGHDGFAGEVGHVIMNPNGRLCGCGRKGCLETYCSATGIVKTYIELKLHGLQKDAHSFQLADGKKIDAKYIYDMAVSGEEDARAAFKKTGDMLGLAMANSVLYTSPEAIFLFGGLAQSGELIFAPTKESFERNVLNIYRNKIKILPSLLNENEAAILGASSLIWNEKQK